MIGNVSMLDFASASPEFRTVCVELASREHFLYELIFTSITKNLKFYLILIVYFSIKRKTYFDFIIFKFFDRPRKSICFIKRAFRKLALLRSTCV